MTATVHTSTKDYLAALDASHERLVPGGVVVSEQGWALASQARLPQGSVVADALAALGGGQPSAPELRAAFSERLAALHRRAIADVLALAMRRLDQRSSEGANLLNRQLVQGSVADVALALTEADDLLALPGTPARLANVLRLLVNAGRTAVKLHGASGFLADGPGTLVYLTELAGNTYFSEAGHD